MGDKMRDLRDPKFWASVAAWMVVVSIIVLWSIGIYKNWTIFEIGTIMGAVAGPFAGLAGFLYIYVNFIEQQKQFNQQHSQFEKQTFETVFFNLLMLFRGIYPNSSDIRPRMVILDQKLKHCSHSTRNTEDQGIIIQERRKIFMNVFEGLESKNQAFIQSIYGICTHVEVHGRSIIPEYYLGVLIRQLDRMEINFLFYGVITGQGMYQPTEHYKRVLSELLRAIDSFVLFIPGDLDLLEHFSSADATLLSE
jgi:hypothetical protein